MARSYCGGSVCNGCLTVALLLGRVPPIGPTTLHLRFFLRETCRWQSPASSARAARFAVLTIILTTPLVRSKIQEDDEHGINELQ